MLSSLRDRRERGRSSCRVKGLLNSFVLPLSAGVSTILMQGLLDSFILPLSAILMLASSSFVGQSRVVLIFSAVMNSSGDFTSLHTGQNLPSDISDCTTSPLAEDSSRLSDFPLRP